MIGVTSFGADAVFHGVILGLVYGVLAAGLVLVFRASGVVNFAHGEAGALGAAVLAKLVLDEHWPFLVALPAVLALGGGIGALTEVLVVRRLADRPRLALLVATIGLSQLLLVGELVLPKINEVAPYPSLVHRQLSVGPVRVTGPDFLAIAAVPAIVAGLAIWLTRTPSGRALRASADNPTAARLAGVRPRRVAMLAWVIAGIVSTATAVIADPLQGVVVGQQTETIGVGLLVRALVAALAGGLESLPLALAGGIGVGLVQALADTGHISQSSVDLVLLVAVLLLVLVRSSARRERGAPVEGELVKVAPVTGRRPWGWAGLALVGAAALLPLVAGRPSELFSLSRVALYAVVGLSVVVLTGWTGQLSLGQFAVVGIGTFGAGALEAHGVPFWVTVPAAAVLAAGVSALVGLPALRARGLDLAVTTLALAVAASSWLFTQSWLLETGGVAVVERGRLLGIDLRGPLAYYEVCVGALAVGLTAVATVRRADFGRRLLAVRANERRAAASAVSPAATKLIGFALAGVLAGVAGALLAGLRIRSGPADFGPQESLQVVALAVIGGAGSAGGAVIGAVFVLGVPAIFGDTTVAGLLPTGLGLLVLVLAAPGGLVELGQRLLGRRLSPSASVSASTSAASAGAASAGAVSSAGAASAGAASSVDAASSAGSAGAASGVAPGRRAGTGAAALSVRGLTVRFGGRLALDGVDLAAAPAELVGLVGANGAGKSTLLDAVSGFVVPSAGCITMDGRDLGRRSPAARAREGLGRVMQDARLFDDLTVEEAVLVGADAGGSSTADRARRAAAAMELFGLEAWAEIPCQHLSTGNRRRAELACAIAGRPRLLLLDEPTAGLGAADAAGMGPLISRLRHETGVTVVLVEHDVPLVLSVADRIVCLGAGRVIGDGPPDEVIRDADVVASFLGGDPDAVARGGA